MTVAPMVRPGRALDTMAVEPVDAAERALLGGLLVEPERLPEVAEIVSAGDFYRRHHAALFAELERRQRAGLPIGLVEIASDYASQALDLLGGASYLAELPEQCVSTSHLPHYAEQVRERAMRRRLFDLGRTLAIAAAGQGEHGMLTPLDLAETWTKGILGTTAPVRRDLSVREAWVAAEEQRGHELYYPTGFPELDEMLDGGLTPGDLCVVGARASMGKTAFALSVAELLSSVTGVGFASLEMRTPKLADRVMSRASNVAHSAVKTGHRSSEQERVLEHWSGGLSERLRIWHSPGADLSAILAQFRRWWSTGIRVMMLDYLTLVREPEAYRGENRSLRVGRVVQAVKDLAGQLGFAAVICSQLSRESDRGQRPGRRRSGSGGWWDTAVIPQESDLAWSTEIENVADMVLFPLRADRLGVREAKPSDAVLYLAKNRNGATGFAPCRWHGETASYRPFSDPNPTLVPR